MDKSRFLLSLLLFAPALTARAGDQALLIELEQDPGRCRAA